MSGSVVELRSVIVTAWSTLTKVRDHGYPALAVRDTAAAWAEAYDRIVVALVHGSVASRSPA